MPRFVLTEVHARGKCRKPACPGLGSIHRHHKRSQYMFVRNFGVNPNRNRSKKYRRFVRRYHAFRKEDVVPICDAHHEEIHLIYNEIIHRDQADKGWKPLREYSWDEANRLMDKLESECDAWLKRRTPGVKNGPLFRAI